MTNKSKTGHPTLTIVCENYWPEVASTGQLITELAEGLSPFFSVEVLTAQPRYHGEYDQRSRSEIRHGVTVRRLRTTRFAKSSRLGRSLNWLTFLLSLCVAVATRWHGRTYLFVTNPPTAPWAAIIAKIMCQRTFILVYDLYPDLAEAVGAIPRGGFVARLFDVVNRFSFRRVNCIIVVGRDMEARLRHKLGPDARIVIVPNWADPDVISPREKTSSEFARAHDLTDRFVFLYAGNLGLFQDLESLVHAVDSLDGLGRDAMVVFVGDGAKRSALEELARESDRVRVLDYVPYEQLGDLYAAADVGLIALEPGVEKTNVPSKTYSILAAGRPFLAVADGSSDLEALADDGCGLVVKNDSSHLTAAMSHFLTRRDDVVKMGRRARQVFIESYTKQAIIGRYRQLLSERRVG